MSETLLVECPACRRRSRVPRGFAGRTAACPGCRADVQAVPVDEARVESGRLVAPAEPTPPAAAESKACPYCGERLRAEARKCRFCGEFLEAELAARRRRATAAGHQRGWNLPGFVCGLLGLQTGVLVLCALPVAADGARVGTLAAACMLVLVALLLLASSFGGWSDGTRATQRILGAANLVAVALGTAFIAALHIPPRPPSVPLALLGLGLAGASAWAVHRAIRARREG